MDRRGRVELIFSGHYTEAGTGPLEQERHALELLGWYVYAAARLPARFPDPRHTARARGATLRTCTAARECWDGVDATGLCFPRCADPWEHNLDVLHRLAHRELNVYGHPYTDAGAWILTGAILLPRPLVGELLALGLTIRDIQRQIHSVPAWFVKLRIADLRHSKHAIREEEVRPR